MDEIKELITTVLDVLALLLLAAGTGVYVWQVHPGYGLVAAGLVVMGGSAIAERMSRKKGAER